MYPIKYQLCYDLDYRTTLPRCEESASFSSAAPVITISTTIRSMIRTEPNYFPNQNQSHPHPHLRSSPEPLVASHASQKRTRQTDTHATKPLRCGCLPTSFALRSFQELLLIFIGRFPRYFPFCSRKALSISILPPRGRRRSWRLHEKISPVTQAVAHFSKAQDEATFEPFKLWEWPRCSHLSTPAWRLGSASLTRGSHPSRKLTKP